MTMPVPPTQPVKKDATKPEKTQEHNVSGKVILPSWHDPYQHEGPVSGQELLKQVKSSLNQAGKLEEVAPVDTNDSQEVLLAGVPVSSDLSDPGKEAEPVIPCSFDMPDIPTGKQPQRERTRQAARGR